MTKNYHLQVTDDDGTVTTIETFYLEKLLNFVGDRPATNTNILTADPAAIIEIIDQWAKDNLPPLPPPEVMARIKEQSKQEPPKTTELTVG